MTLFEQAVLQILAASPEAMGWYQIERRLSNLTLDERPPLPPVLGKLVGDGLLQELSAASAPLVRYLITDAGLALLRSPRS